MVFFKKKIYVTMSFLVFFFKAWNNFVLKKQLCNEVSRYNPLGLSGWLSKRLNMKEQYKVKEGHKKSALVNLI